MFDSFFWWKWNFKFFYRVFFLSCHPNHTGWLPITSRGSRLFSRLEFPEISNQENKLWQVCVSCGQVKKICVLEITKQEPEQGYSRLWELSRVHTFASTLTSWPSCLNIPLCYDMQIVMQVKMMMTMIRLLSPWPMKRWFSQFPVAFQYFPTLACTLLRSPTLSCIPALCALPGPHSCASPLSRAASACLLPVLGHPCVCPLVTSLANAP